MMGRLNHDQGRLFYSFCLEEAVPDDHLVRKVAAVFCSGSDIRINEPGKRAEPVLKIPSAFRSPLAQTPDPHQHTHL
jgi:hypothetical protein